MTYLSATRCANALKAHGSRLVGVWSVGLALVFGLPALAATPLADQPLFSNTMVPGNLALALSVEFPTAISRAHSGSTYSPTTQYLGYFDPNKCYLYNWDAQEPNRYWYPNGAAPANRNCGSQTSSQVVDQSAQRQKYRTYGKWSGNYLNWVTMQTIDPFRWALTGGYRVSDTTTTTIIEKAWGSAQGGEGSNFARKSLDAGTAGGATPFQSALTSRVWGLGNIIRITGSGDLDASGAAYSGPGGFSPTQAYEFSVRVKVCDSDVVNAGPLEANCVAYGSNYKPEGLMQLYSNRIRYSAFGYLNDGNLQRDAGVLRARQTFIGPTKVIPGQPDATNALREWDPATGIFYTNPDPTDASDTATAYGVTVTNSGVMNYLNKFGSGSNSYKTYDPVSELYYAAVRYYKNLGNVSAWSDASGASKSTKTTWVDGFPVITTWDDPIQYSCQRNFILGIGDTNTHADKNVPGLTTRTEVEPVKPAAVNADPLDSVVATNKVGFFQGLGDLGNVSPYIGGNNYNSALMAGIAYNVNTTDIRADLTGAQTIQTYWLDVLESGFASNNQFYLAAKYGGFKVPDSWSYDTSADANFFSNNKALWSTSGDLVGAQDRPDNYYTADRPDLMVAGLTKAFASIAASLKAFTTSFAVPTPQLATSGNVSYSSSYDATAWTGEVTGSLMGFDSTGAPTTTPQWLFSAKLGTQTVTGSQVYGTGWDLKRRMVTWNPTIGTTGGGVAFRYANLSAAQKLTLDTPYRTGDDGATYLNYLRGNQTEETVAVEPYRPRASLVGDIVGSKAQPVGPPNLPLSDSTNPGYAAFRAFYATRPTIVYAGSNDGSVHAVYGALTGNGAGQEVFAYIPNAVYAGPNNTPSVDGLASRGNPVFTHKYLVNATPNVYDIDFGVTVGSTGTDWRSVLIGGLGKGGKSYYAIDVSDPVNMVDEATVASKVLWEFTDPDMGYSFGDPVVVKMAKYGWVVIFTSGYNNPDGKGYFFIVNPKTGALLKKISTLTGTVAAPAGMTYANAFVVDRTNGVADAIYAGDLLGNVWRQDLTVMSNTFPDPVRFAALTDGTSPQPITTRPLVEVQPVTNKRFVFVGTGKLLADADVASTQVQSFYAIVDGTGAHFAATLPTGFTYPFGRSKLAANANLATGVTYDPATQMGWYVDLGSGTSNIGWRVVTAPTSFFGTIAFAATLPSGDACTPSGSSRVYPLDFGTGQTKLISTNNSTYLPIAGIVTDLKFVGVGGKDKLVAGTDTGTLKDVPRTPTAAPVLRRLNWRELPTIN